MDSKLVLALFLFSSWVLGVFSDGNAPADQASTVANLRNSLVGILDQANPGRGSAPCMQKLMPCEPYLHSNSTPPSTCCLPLKEMISSDSECLCKVFDNPQLLKSFNLTQEQALALPKACGANPDVSVCKNATSPGSLPATGSSSGNSTAGGSHPSAAGARTVAHAGGFLVTSFLALIISAFY